MTKKRSPVKELRDLKRSIAFIRRKNSSSPNSKPFMSICPQQNFSTPPANGPDLSFVNLPSFSVSPKVLRKPNLGLSRITYLEISPSSNLPISVSSEQVHAPQIHTHQQDDQISYSPPKYPLDIRNYPQHKLDDEDPEIREIKRQENVRTTLRMIDDALKFSN